ncbi:hypothetical protein GH714_039556 [Hevea brasiliensis]|uniref:Uncharacterized protein n=1 Tax=Hevea brasiliensis TaxID=3981 RepID=A0A6A6KEJ9_HEVBR|nr:hypothetical protein GH714_039556 [Hevea brasiliensis]
MTNCMCSCSKPLIVDKPIHNVSFSISTERLPINLGVLPSATTAAIATSRVFPVRASMVDSYESSSNFAKRMEQACNQDQLRALLAAQMGMLNANGVQVQASSFLVIICSVKSPPETLLVSFVLGSIMLCGPVASTDSHHGILEIRVSMAEPRFGGLDRGGRNDNLGAFIQDKRQLQDQ